MNDRNLRESKSVLITGASSGIGEACALYLDQLGYKVFAGVRSDAALEKIKRNANKGMIPLLLDVTNLEQIQAVMNRLTTELGEVGLDGLINCAGYPLISPIEFLDLSEFRNQLEVNLIGCIAVTKACIPLLRLARGKIINISSASGIDAAPFLGPYAASKFALEAISDALRVELKPWQIHVVIIEPGDVATPSWEKIASKSKQLRQSLPEVANELYGPVLDVADDIKMHGMPPQVIARAVEFILSVPKPKARYRVGVDAKMVAFIHRLPTHWRDHIVMRMFPKYGPEVRPGKKQK